MPSKNLPGDSVPAARKKEHAEQHEKAKQPAKAAAAPPQIFASDSAPPQVDVLGSVEVAAPLQVGSRFPRKSSFTSSQNYIFCLS